jgi:histidinol-phosphatase (PHP family)
MYDSHIHTPLCKHAAGSPVEYLQAAKDQELSGIVFTDHCPMPAWFDADFRMGIAELPLYHSLLESLRSDTDLYVGIGLEADYHPGTEYFIKRLRERYAYDYLIGSVHYIGSWPLDHPRFVEEYTQRDLREIYRSYFELVCQAARSGLYHSIGHLDLPKKFGHLPEGGYLDLAQEALQIIAEEGLALDVNTAGWRKPIDELYPSLELLKQASQLGIPVVLGSDAHKPSELGHRFTDAKALLQEAGYTEAAVFVEGKPRYYAIAL